MENKTTFSKKLSLTAILTASAVILEILPIDIPFPLFSKLTIDITGVPLLLVLYLADLKSSIAATIFTGIAIALPRPPFKPPNPYGAFFKAIAEISTILGVWLFRKYWKNSEKSMVTLSFTGGSILRMIVMMIANYIFLPLFYGLPPRIVISIIPVVGIFNIVQAFINIILAYLVYRAIKRRIPNLF